MTKNSSLGCLWVWPSFESTNLSTLKNLWVTQHAILFGSCPQWSHSNSTHKHVTLLGWLGGLAPLFPFIGLWFLLFCLIDYLDSNNRACKKCYPSSTRFSLHFLHIFIIRWWCHDVTSTPNLCDRVRVSTKCKSSLRAKLHGVSTTHLDNFGILT